MLKFTVTSAGQTAINGASESSPVIIDTIALFQGDRQTIKSISEFGGSVYKDDSGIGEYVKISFEDSSSTAYTITSLDLMSGSTVIATSNPITVVKASGKGLQLEISCQFAGASKCSFNTITIALPHATKFREGVLRLARTTGETEKDFTVYNAADVESKIEASAQALESEYVPWTKTGTTVNTGEVKLDTILVVDAYDTPTAANTVTIEATSSGLNIDKTLTGNVVASSPTITSGSITTSNKVVNEAYISSLYSNTVDTASPETTGEKLVTSHAVRTYVEAKESDFVHKSGTETITGAKTFTESVVISGTGKSLTTPEVSSASYTGDGVYTTYIEGTGTGGWGNDSSASKLPTVSAVTGAINAGDNAVTTAFQLADNDLQSQIDAINAGQNLADIVDLCADLTGHSLTGLKAKGDGTFTIGDKIEVLHDKTKSDGSQDPTAKGVSTVYELVKGTIDTTTYPKDKQSTVDTDYYWHYIGEYGVDAYTKAESDTNFVAKANLDQSISSTSSTTNAPSTKAVYDHVNTAISTAGNAYVKLTSDTNQTIASSLTIKASTSATPTLSIPDGQSITSNSTLTIKADNTTNAVSTVYDLTNKAFIIKEGISSPDTYLDLRKIGATSTPDVSGDLVASYRDVTGATLTDGRLVTVDYLKSYTGDLSGYAKLNASNTFTGTTNTFNGVSATSYTGDGVYSSYDSTSWGTATTQIPTVASVKSAIADSKADTLDDISTVDAIGSIGLFIYSGTGTELGIGHTVSGSDLKPVAMSLPMSGQISYKAVATSSPLTGTWTLLSAAFKRTATEPCLVLAQKTSNP